MSAIPLFDLMASSCGDGADGDRVSRLAQKIVVEAIARFEQTESLAEDCASIHTSPVNRDVAILLRSMSEEDVQYAERVFTRVVSVARSGAEIAGIDRLKDLYGRTKARLSITFESIDEAKEQIRQGKFFTGAQVRDEFQRQILTAGTARAGKPGN